jgi:uncharacterized membrane-anchored protein
MLGNNAGKVWLSKVPEVTLIFWLVKVMGTTVGETAADFLAKDLNLGLGTTTAIMTAVLIAAFILQIWSKEYSPWKYWLTVILVSVVGTLITDNMTDNLGVPLVVSTVLFAVLLVLTFVIWYLVEKTLSIHSIFTLRRELFYWATILFTFALGTAGGDWLSEQVNLGYLSSGLVFAAGIAAVALAFYGFKWDGVWSFWAAYILTRPLGASFGDLLVQPSDGTGLGIGSTGGLGFGLAPVNAVFLLAIVILVVVMTVQKALKSASR